MPVTHYRGVSVMESGYMVGPKLAETTLLPLNNFSGQVGCSPGLQRFDSGTTTFSGIAQTSFSTRLSSIIYATASVTFAAGTTAAAALSGPSFVAVAWSGNCLDFTTFRQNSGGTVTSAGVNATIAWLAIG